MKQFAIVLTLLATSIMLTSQISLEPNVNVLTVIVPEKVQPMTVESEYQLEEYPQEITYESLRMDEHDVTTPSNASEELLNLAIEGTNLENFGYAYIEAEKVYGINAIYLLSLTIWESGWGESPLAVKKNNVSGFMAYDLNPYDSAKSYSCKSESIMDTAKLISRGYVSNGRRSISAIGDIYASDENWSDGVKSVSKTVLKRIEKKSVE